MTEAEKYPAPALARGLELIDALARDGAATLEQLAQRTAIPKASLLRLLDTLIALGRVARDPATRRYASLVRLVPTTNALDRHRPQLRQLLRELATTTGSTAEWYEPQLSHLVLTDRAEPQGTEVFLKARVGFRRELDGELEAVARIALAADVPCPAAADYWEYDLQGKPASISTADAGRRIRAAAQDLLTMDRNWNANGVRRYAAGIRRDQDLLGIVALAETFTPGADQRIDRQLQALRQAADQFQTLINRS